MEEEDPRAGAPKEPRGAAVAPPRLRELKEPRSEGEALLLRLGAL